MRPARKISILQPNGTFGVGIIQQGKESRLFIVKNIFQKRKCRFFDGNSSKNNKKEQERTDKAVGLRFQNSWSCIYSIARLQDTKLRCCAEIGEKVILRGCDGGGFQLFRAPGGSGLR